MLEAPELTVTRLRELLNYDPETGVFRWKSDRMNGRYKKQIAARAGDVFGGEHGNGYLRGSLDGKKLFQHRLAWLYVHGEWPACHIDHIDGNRANNAISNLRAATRFVNNQNLHAPKVGNKIGLLGVCKHKNGYKAQIVIDGKNRHIGCFRSAQEAHEAYLNAKRASHEGCTI